MSGGDLLVFKVSRLVFEGSQRLEVAVVLRHNCGLIGEESIAWFQRLYLIHGLVA